MSAWAKHQILETNAILLMIGALIVNLTIAVNHRRDYYIAY